jgi:hypothetical protein
VQALIETDKRLRSLREWHHSTSVTTNRQTSGEGYRLLQEAFERLRGTSIATDIRTGGQRVREGFGINDGVDVPVLRCPVGACLGCEWRSLVVRAERRVRWCT